MKKANLTNSIELINRLTDELLEIADVLEEYEVNVRLDDGSYLNPVSNIRGKVDIIWDEVTGLAKWIEDSHE